MSVPPTPDWLSKRDGGLAPGIRPHILFVMLSRHPQYRLEARPAKGQYECVVLKTVSGRPIDAAADVYPNADAAFAGGLARLKAQLGW